MDERDEHEPEDPYRAEPVTERVRIVGAEPAATLAGEGPDGAPADPEHREERYLGFVHEPVHHHHAPPPPPAVPPPPVEAYEERAEDEAAPAAPELPHWTEPPTGQVPAVLDRRGDEDEDAWTAAGDTGPVWREHEHEWEDTSFQPSMLADDETRVGVLEETPVEERRPWEFDDLRRDEDEGGALDLGAGGAPVDEAGAPAAAGAAGPGTSWWDAGAEETTGERFDALIDRPEAPATLAMPSIGTAADSTPAWLEEDEPTGASLDTTTFGAGGGPDAPAPALGDVLPSAPDEAGSPASEGPSTASVPGATTMAPHGVLGPAESDPVGGAGAVDRPRRRRPPPTPPAPTRSGARNVPVAVATGVALAGVALGCFAAGTVATLALATVIVTLAAAECFAALRRTGMRPATLLGLVATVAVMVSAYSKGTAAVPLVLVLVVVTSMVWYLVGAERGAPVEGISATVLGFAWVGLLGSFSGLLLAPSIYPHRHGIAFLFGAVVATVGEDVGALAVGSWLGRHQLAPHVSPNKTWEGLIGGAVVAVVASALITGHVHPWTPGKAAILGLVAAVVAPVGDLCESLVKRDLGLKDMGSLLPGHGGVLDRVDALLFVLPATYYLVRVLNLG